MKKKTLRFILSLCCVCVWLSNAVTQPVYFDDTQGDSMIVGNDNFELTLRKSNGSISSIVDKSTGLVLSHGNQDQNLWGVELFSTDFIGSREYGAGTKNSFNYVWDAQNNKLTLSYTPNPTAPQLIDVDLQLSISDQAYFDLSVELIHTRNDTIKAVIFPNDLLFQPDEMKEAILPLLPGVRFNENFFKQHRIFGYDYPSALVFSDYVYLRSSSGQLAMFSILNKDITPKAGMLFNYNVDWNYYTLGRGNNVCIPKNLHWESPILRIHIGEGCLQTVEDYRDGTGLAFLPSIRDKLGSLYDKVSNALWIVFNPGWVLSDIGFNMTRHDLYQKMWQNLPGPSILFITGWPRGGQDESNPDVFPVDPSLGSDEDFRIVCEAAHDAGHLIMPYINPTFWDDESETAQSLQLEDFVVFDRYGQPQYECYGPHCGYAASPYAPAVIERLDRLMQELISKIPTDIIFEDQVGSRGGLDFNKHMPDPAHHAQGWLEHTRRHKNLLLTVEHDHDRQVETHIGYLGNLILYIKNQGFGDSAWGAGNWEYYPIVPIMARDKIFFYTANTPDSKQLLNWTISMGQILVFADPPGRYNSYWHKTIDSFHRYVVSRFADERMLDFVRVSENVTRSRFESYEVLSNWSSTQILASGDHSIAAEGFIVTNDANDLTAGIFTKYNGQDLTAGDHYIIESQYADSIVVRHPQGEDTAIKLHLQSLSASAETRCYGFTEDLIFEVPVAIDSPYISFNMNRYYDDKEVTRYVVVPEPVYMTITQLQEPADWASVASTHSALQWHSVAGASSYQIQIATDKTFQQNIIDSTAVVETQFSSDSLKAGTTYFWRVRAVGALNTGPWSFVRRFRVDGINTNDRLVAYYPFSGSPGDAIGKNNGTLIGNVTLAPDRFENPGQAYSFAGDDDYIRFSESEPYTALDKQMTMSAWIYPKTLARETGVMVRDYYWVLLINEDGLALGYVFNENQELGLVTSGQKKIPLGKWSLLAYAHDGQTIKMYLNGIICNQTQFSSTRIGNPEQPAVPTLGKGIDAYWNDFNGMIDEVRVYDRSLSPDEMAELYRKTATENFPPQIVTFSPAIDTAITEGDSLAFFIAVDDEDNDTLFCTWSYDATSIATDTTTNGTSSILIHFPPGSAGTHSVKASVSDGKLLAETTWSITVKEIVTGIQLENNIPTEYFLNQNYPNPFNPETAIEYQLPRASEVEISIFNLQGQKVATLVSEKQSAGYYNIVWDAAGFAAGVYFCRMEAGKFVKVTKLLLLK